MKKYLDKSIIEIDSNAYLLLIVFLAPLLNFLAGINIDIYSPSMPAIASYFNASIMATKNTISITLLGWTIGALFTGILIDSLGRKKILVYCLFFYVIASLFALLCHTIHQLMIVRFIQGFTISAITIGCRALIVDIITGPRYPIAILYTSLGYGLGPIIGPFIGGILQHYVGWHANFIALAVIGAFLLFILFIFINESIPKRQPLILKHISSSCLSVIMHRKFISGVIISGLIQIQLMIYPTLGPFIVEGILHRNVLVYGNTALIIGASYLVGTLICRFLLKYITPKNVCYFGYVVLIVGLSLAYVFAILFTLGLATVMLPIILICISAGMVFVNIMGANLRQFPNNVGISMAIQTSLLLLISSAGIFIISHIHIINLLQLALIFSVLIVLELFIFFFGYRKIFDPASDNNC